MSSSTSLYQCVPIPSGDRSDLAALQSIRMAVLHNIIIRGINSMISYAPEIQTSELPAFLKYCEQFDYFLHHHHALEEEVYFDMIEKKLGQGSMKDNVDGHQTFKAPYEAWNKSRESLAKGEAKWNPSDFIAEIRAFTEPLLEHLKEEIDTLKVDVIREKFTPAELQHIEKTMEAASKKGLNPVWHPPFLFINGDGVNGKWFPPAPAPVIFLCRDVLFRLHTDVWKYGCADKNMKVKERFAAYEPVVEAA
ncbi:hypothetical protein FRC03_000126 [Tulasnella sp. 419]|nr:hypothetical protein FRC03_000126 [Tulasnella sp. 419]